MRRQFRQSRGKYILIYYRLCKCKNVNIMKKNIENNYMNDKSMKTVKQ